MISSTLPSNDENIYLKTPQISSPCPALSPLNLVEDEQSSTTSIIMFQEDTKR